ncbi:BMP family ABC transporter substrate-binding protein [Rhizobium sp. PAMB 3182]
MRKTIVTLLILACGSLGITAARADEKPKICFIYAGSKTDGAWSQAHEQGRQALQEKFGDKIQTSYLENILEGPEAEGVIQKQAASGCQMIFATSFGFMEPVLKVAADFPDVKFEYASGYKVSGNVATYTSRFYEGRYIAGQIAAKVSKTGVAGYVASFPIPEVIRGIDAFLLGGRSVDPAFKLKVGWANAWFDPGVEADVTKKLIGEGADVITQHTDSAAPMQVAEEMGVKAFGQASDMISVGPHAQLSAIMDTWGAYYIRRVQAFLDGKWEAQRSWEGLADGILTMAPYTNMPDDVKAMAEATEKKIKSGELKPFSGPIHKQDGSLWLPDGETADDRTLLGLNFLVQGVEGEMPH